MKKVEEKQEAKTITLYLDVRKVKLDNGREFLAYKTPIGKLNLDVKFTKDMDKEAPTENGYYVFETDKINLDTRKDYPALWIRK